MKQNTVYTKHGKAIVADTQAELESIAKQIGGDVVLLSRRDGQDSYDEIGTVVLSYEFGKDFTEEDMKYGTDQSTYTVRSVDDYRQALDTENNFIREMTDETALIKKDADVVKELATFKAGDCMFLRFINGQQYFDTFRREQTNWHDADVTEYQLAVVPK